MLLPLEVAQASDLRAEVCVVGTGPSGQAVARALAESGRDVLMVEAGEVDATRWGRRFAAAATPSRGRQYPDAGRQSLVRLGGTSALWGVQMQPGMTPGSGSGLRLHRAGEVDFGPRPRLGVEAWPISIDDLCPWYGQAEELFGLGRNRSWRAEPIGDDCLVTNDLFWAVPGAPFLSAAIPGVRTVFRCPILSLTAEPGGRITGARAVDRAGGISVIQADVFVLALGAIQTARLLLESRWSPAGSVANSSGLVGRYLTDHPQLVLGQLLLHRSADLARLEPLMVTTEQGSTGPLLRWPNLVTSPWRSSTAELTRLAATLVPIDAAPRYQQFRNRVPRPFGARTGSVGAVAAIRDAVEERRFDRSLIGRIPSILGGLDEVLAELGPTRHRSSWRVEDPHWAHLLQGDGPAGFQIFAVAEQLPSPDNRIVLSDQTNQIGARRPRAHWRWSGEDRRLAERAADDMRAALADLGVGHVVQRRGRAAVLKINSHHAAGTTRMSSSPSDGVVDHNLRTHDHPNLYVSGSGVFNANGYLHPTLTDVALGLRLGRHLAGC